MLISAIRILLFLLLVAAGIWGIFHLIEDQGGITIQIAGQEYIFKPVNFAVMLLIGFVAFAPARESGERHDGLERAPRLAPRVDRAIEL